MFLLYVVTPHPETSTKCLQLYCDYVKNSLVFFFLLLQYNLFMRQQHCLVHTFFVLSQVQKQKVEVVLQVQPYSKWEGITMPEATRADTDQAQIHIHPSPRQHLPLMSKGHQELKRQVRLLNILPSTVYQPECYFD